jgi:hypothetical protein
LPSGYPEEQIDLASSSVICSAHDHSENIDDSFAHARERIREQLLNSLARNHHEIYRVIRAADGLRPGERYKRYQEAVDDPKTRQAVVKYRC